MLIVLLPERYTNQQNKCMTKLIKVLYLLLKSILKLEAHLNISISFNIFTAWTVVILIDFILLVVSVLVVFRKPGTQEEYSYACDL